MTTIQLYEWTPPVDVPDLTEEERETLGKLLKQWGDKRARNQLRQEYLDCKQKVKDLGVSIPETLREKLDVVIGWPETAVYALASRCMWDGPAQPGDEDSLLRQVLEDNRFDLEISQVIASSMTHSVAFMTTTADDERGALIRGHSAEWATALWDPRRREISAGLVITEATPGGRPVELLLLTRREVVTLTLTEHGWTTDRQTHGLSRVPMEAFPYRPSLDRPFGRSRISRRVMSITDRAIRNAVRADVSGEFYMAPHLFLLGAGEDAFTREGTVAPIWTWMQGRIKALEANEDGEKPSIHETRQQTMQPYLDQMRALAAEFAGATGVPVSSLGVIHDNPASAQAIYAAKEDLVVEATNANRVYGYALKRIYQNALMLATGTTEVTAEMRQIGTRWRNPAMPSVVSQSDAMVKQISAIPWLSETEVALEELGYTDEQIIRLRSERRRAALPDILERITTAGAGSGQQSEAADLKLKFEALGQAVRAGVDPDAAAQMLGLSGVKFTGAVPVSLRMPEMEAAGLEEK